MKKIKITENDLRQIVEESVVRILTEGQMGTTLENLDNAYKLLQDIMNSSFIPFTSPNPSSTEEELKDAIIEAARMIDKAKYLCGQLGYGTVNRTLGDDPNVNLA